MATRSSELVLGPCIVLDKFGYFSKPAQHYLET